MEERAGSGGTGTASTSTSSPAPASASASASASAFASASAAGASAAQQDARSTESARGGGAACALAFAKWAFGSRLAFGAGLNPFITPQPAGVYRTRNSPALQPATLRGMLRDERRMMIAHQQATQHSAPALRRPFDDWLLPTEPSPSPLRHRSPLTCLNNVYASCYSPKLLRARPSPSSDSATQTSPPTHQNNVYASAYAPKPLPQPGFASSYPPKPQCQVVATQTSPPTHRKLTTTTSQPALRPTAITATEVAKQPSACARLALADWSMSADERALRALTAGFTPRAFHVAEGVPYLGIGKVSTKSVSTKHDAQEMSFWMQERSRCKAIAQAAMAAGCVLQKPRSRRWAAAYQEEEAEEETDCKTDGEQSDEATADGEAFVFVGSSIVDAFQNGSAQPGPRSAERTNPLVAMVLAGFDALRGRGSG